MGKRISTATRLFPGNTFVRVWRVILYSRRRISGEFLEDDFGLLWMPESAIAEMHFDVGYLDQFVLDNSSYTTLRCKELATICDPRVRQWFEEQGIERITFGDLKIKPLLSTVKATVLFL